MQPVARHGAISLPTATISALLMTAPSMLKTVISELGAVISGAETGLRITKDGACRREGHKKAPPDVCTSGGAVV